MSPDLGEPGNINTDLTFIKAAIGKQPFSERGAAYFWQDSSLLVKEDQFTVDKRAVFWWQESSLLHTVFGTAAKKNILLS